MDGWMDGWMENIRQHHRKSELYLNSIQQIRDYNKFVCVRYKVVKISFCAFMHSFEIHESQK